MEGQAPAAASALQLSTFTKIQSIPRAEKSPSFPVTVRLTAPGPDQPVRIPVDVVAAFDISMSTTFRRDGDTDMLELEKAALQLVIGKLGPDDRLAVLPFFDDVAKDADAKEMERLVPVSGQRKQRIADLVKARTHMAGRGNRFSKALDKAEKILMERPERDDVAGGRAAFIVLLSDGRDDDDRKEWLRVSTLKAPMYPAHTFGFLKHKADTLRRIAEKTGGTYLPEDIATGDDLGKFAAAFEGLLSRPFSAADARLGLMSAHPKVSISKVESLAGTGQKKASVGEDARSGTVDVGAVSAGETAEFTVYVDVPEGDAGADVMEVLVVDGSYTQAWDGKPAKLGPSVMSVNRPAPPPRPGKRDPLVPSPDPCRELDWIEERLEYWCKVKQELSAKYGSTEEAEASTGGKCQYHFVAALREAALESINRAMHQDIYTAVVQAIKLRRCGTGGEGETTTEHQDAGEKAAAPNDGAI